MSWAKILNDVAADLRRREWFSLLVVAVAAWICFSGIAGDNSMAVNREATQEVASGLESWHQPGLGYQHAGAFLGGYYPSRQYLMVACPTIWLGRGLVPLRLGFAVLFFTGFCMFMTGMRAWWQRKLLSARDARLFAALAGATLLTFPIVISWLRQYEQTIIPISFVMLATGWLAAWLARPTSTGTPPLAWAAGMLGTCYTPGLAAWTLFLGLIITLAGWRIRRGAWREGILLATMAVYALSMGAVATWNLRTLNPTKFSTVDAISQTALTGAQLAARMAEGFRAILTHPSLPYVHPAVMFLFLAHFAWLATRRPSGRAWLHIFIWVWAVTVVIAALAMRGYCYRPPAFDLHRSMVAIPLLVFAVVEFSAIAFKPALPTWRPILYAGGLSLLAIGVFQCLRAVDPATEAPVLPTQEAEIAQRALDFAKRLPTAEDSRFAVVLPAAVFPAMRDLTWYFAPGAQIYHEPLETFLRTNPGMPFMALILTEGPLPERMESSLLPSRADLSLPRIRLVNSEPPAN